MEFYGYKKCSTCRKAHLHLTQLGFDVPFRDFVENPPSPATLRDWILRRGEGITPFINTKGTSVRALGDRVNDLTESDWIQLMSEDGKLIKRPVLITADGVLIGYQPQGYDKLRA